MTRKGDDSSKRFRRQSGGLLQVYLLENGSPEAQKSSFLHYFVGVSIAVTFMVNLCPKVSISVSFMLSEIQSSSLNVFALTTYVDESSLEALNHGDFIAY